MEVIGYILVVMDLVVGRVDDNGGGGGVVASKLRVMDLEVVLVLGVGVCVCTNIVL